MSNQLVYSNIKIVDEYLRSSHLFKAEKKILKLYSQELAQARVLDIGIGGGRTTGFLLKSCLSYTGVDYSPNMIAACQAKFPTVDFRVHDAAQMDSLEDGSFDFALFSFNGIDCVDLAHRERIFKEIRRVLKPKGRFVFSFHSALCLNNLYRLHFPKNPLNWFKEYRRWSQLRKINGAKEKYQGQDFFKLYDGAEDFKTEVMYVKPSFQLDMLVHQSFDTISCWNAQSGQEIPINEVDKAECFWIYLVCEAQ